jgi:hypothetical protein
MDQTELAAKINVKPQTIQRLCSKGVRSVFSANIADALKINVLWLTDGEGEMELPVQNDFLDKMSALDMENRIIIEALVERLNKTHTVDDEIMAMFNKLSENDRQIIRTIMGNFLSKYPPDYIKLVNEK